MGAKGKNQTGKGTEKETLYPEAAASIRNGRRKSLVRRTSPHETLLHGDHLDVRVGIRNESTTPVAAKFQDTLFRNNIHIECDIKFVFSIKGF